MAEPALLELAASVARLATDSGLGFDAEKPGRSVTVGLTVTAASGAGASLLVVIESSETGLADSTWTEIGRFPKVSGQTNLCISAANPERYARARWEIAGTSPSFTFQVKARAYSHLITRQQFFDHISPSMAMMAYDDSNVGAASASAVDATLAYASSMLRGKLGPVDDLEGLTPEQQSEAIRVGLDICHARAAMRAPEVFRFDGGKLLDCARKDLKEIRTGLADAGVGPPGRPPVESLAAGATTLPRRWR